MLHKHRNTANAIVEFEEEQRRRLCSNGVGNRCSSLNLAQELSQEEMDLLEVLAEIISDALIWQNKNGYLK